MNNQREIEKRRVSENGEWRNDAKDEIIEERKEETERKEKYGERVESENGEYREGEN